MKARRVRSGLFSLSALCYVAWLAPVGANSQAQDDSASFGTVATLPAPARVPVLRVRRDPFAGEPGAAGPEPTAPGAPLSASADASADAAPASGASGVATSDQAAMAASGFDFANASSRVPDIGDPGGSAGPGSPLDGVTVKATLVGRHAVAYVQNGSVLDIVRVGDRLGDRTIVRIELRGIVFDDGSRLDLGEGRRVTPAPAPTEVRALTLRDLERALARLQAPAQPRPSPEVAVQPSASATLPSPGPLPTVDTRGREPDRTPSSDPLAATPFPVPGIDR